MKYFQFSLAIMFFFFAALQFNDPDPVQWIAIYGFVGIASVLTAIGETRALFRYALMAGLAASIVWMISMLPAFADWISMGAPSIFGSWKEGNQMTELTREFLGVSMCALTLGYQLYMYASRIQVREMQKVMA